LALPELTPTCMTLELADRSITKQIGIAKDVRLMMFMEERLPFVLARRPSHSKMYDGNLPRFALKLLRFALKLPWCKGGTLGLLFSAFKPT
ncbi:hypothetical protein Tco_0119310, partial [Tanacetum coccineum]